ncbi:MAG: hypothetical protein RXO22_08280 [Thermocladium sp.]
MKTRIKSLPGGEGLGRGCALGFLGLGLFLIGAIFFSINSATVTPVPLIATSTACSGSSIMRG